MAYVLGAVIGILIGAVIALVKYLGLWRVYLRKDAEELAKKDDVLLRCLISYILNAAILFAEFLLRNVVPESMNWVAMITATALTLGLLGKFYSISKIGLDI